MPSLWCRKGSALLPDDGIGEGRRISTVESPVDSSPKEIVKRRELRRRAVRGAEGTPRPSPR